MVFNLHFTFPTKLIIRCFLHKYENVSCFLLPILSAIGGFLFDFQVSGFSTDGHDGVYGQKSSTYNFPLKHINDHKAISLPSSPQHFPHQSSLRSKEMEIFSSPDVMSTFNKVIEESKILSKPLLPYQEWNIDFSEITMGTRVGIGMFLLNCLTLVNRKLCGISFCLC